MELSINDLIITTDITELETAGVICEVDPLTADDLGAFEESALTEAEALASSIDLMEVK